MMPYTVWYILCRISFVNKQKTVYRYPWAAPIRFVWRFVYEDFFHGMWLKIQKYPIEKWLVESTSTRRQVNEENKSNFGIFDQLFILAKNCVKECFPERTVLLFYITIREVKVSYAISTLKRRKTSLRRVRQNLIELFRRISSISMFFDLRIYVDPNNHFSLGP